MKRILICLSLTFFVVNSNSLNAQISKIEKQVLIDIYNSTSGEEWTNSWDLKISPENWYGVTIEDNHVLELNLHRNTTIAA